MYGLQMHQSQLLPKSFERTRNKSTEGDKMKDIKQTRAYRERQSPRAKDLTALVYDEISKSKSLGIRRSELLKHLKKWGYVETEVQRTLDILEAHDEIVSERDEKAVYYSLPCDKCKVGK
jgi:hypothetical protein